MLDPKRPGTGTGTGDATGTQKTDQQTDQLKTDQQDLEQTKSDPDKKQ